MKGLHFERLWRKYPTTRPFLRQTQRDKHDFNDRYIAAATKRIKAMRLGNLIPKKKAVISKMWGFFVDVE